MLRNETDVNNGYGGGGYGGFPFGGGCGGGGIFGGALAGGALGAIFGQLFGRFGRGDFGGGGQELAVVDNQLANIRAQIGETNYNNAKDLLTQTNALMLQYASGNYATSTAIWENAMKLQECCCLTNQNISQTKYDLDKSILIQGFQNQLASKDTQRAIDDCCCNTNNTMLRLSLEQQLRDAACCCETQKQIEALRCGQKEIIAYIENQGKNTKIELLEKELRESERRNERMLDERIASRTNCLVTQLGDANRAFNGVNYPWSIPTCGCAGW